MKPYYSEAGITIYHADCREVLPQLVGTVVTDPPYNVGYSYIEYADNLSREEYGELLSVSCRVPSVIIHYPEDICAASWALEEIPEKIVAWVYNSMNPRQWRSIAWFGLKPDFSQEGQQYQNPSDKRIAARIANGEEARLYDWWEFQQVKNVSEEKTEHPCQIPIELMKRILRVTPCETVIDPFMGSGTTLAAAKDLCRKAIGIELSERYCEISANRLRQGVFTFE